MKPFLVKDNVYWIGALHPDLKVFDIIMETKNGTTYNSYLIKDEKIAIVDTVKEKFSEQYIEHIKSLIDPEKIDYIIVHHTEPDHSGSLIKLLEIAPNAQVVCANPAVKYVLNTINRDVNPMGVKNGDTLSLGEKTLTFLSTPFLHWPDTMMTYIEKDKLLFSCDVFASHFCDSKMVDKDIDRDFWPDVKYYFEMIMRPFKKNIRNALKKIEPLEVDAIATSHGPVLKADVQKYIQAYSEWSQETEKNDPSQVLVYYASAHGNTAKMAEKIAEGARSLGCKVDVYDAENLNIAEHLDSLEAADAVLFGSPTINNDVVKPVWDVLNSLATLDMKGKIGAAFGSMGWSGEAVKFIDERLQALKFKVPVEGMSAVLVPSDDELKQCFDFGVEIAKSVN